MPDDATDAAAFFATKPTLTGSRVVLRPFTEADIAAMGPVLADPDVIRLTGSAHTTAQTLGGSPELDERVLRWYRSRAEQTDRIDLAIVDAATDGCVGEIVLNDWSPENRTCNLRILVGPAGRDRGLGSQAVRLLVDHAFERSDLHRIELSVFAFNPRARHVYERCGFVLEGVRRESFRFDDVPYDDLAMAQLRPDWERARATAPQASRDDG